MKQVAVLFARSDSIYKTMPECDVYDIERDARTWLGGMPVVAHPPCRAWGRLRAFAKPRDDEKALAIFAVDQVRRHGGILEHPEASSLWPAAKMPRPGAGVDSFGGWTLPISQFWFGHRAEKKTWLYIVGCAPNDLPIMPMKLGDSPCVIGLWSGRDKRQGMHRKEISKAEREHTPEELAAWLVEIAKRCIDEKN